MSSDDELVRLNPFEGLCLTAADLVTEQRYHRESRHRHTRFLHGNGVVQGLQVEILQTLDRYEAVIRAGYGITAKGQGVHLPADHTMPLEVPRNDGAYVLWLESQERPDPDSRRPVFDTDDGRDARIREVVAPTLRPAAEDLPDGVALTRVEVRLGRMTQIRLPVPRAGRVARAAESYLKPRVEEFVTLNRTVMLRLFRTATVQELSIGAYGFYSALVAADFVLLEEGTADRVLYRAAGRLVRHAHDFYEPLPETTDRIAQFTTFVREVQAETPASTDGDAPWLDWFQRFERLLPHLRRVAEELEATAEARR